MAYGADLQKCRNEDEEQQIQQGSCDSRPNPTAPGSVVLDDLKNEQSPFTDAEVR
jgi:hypothetical protein